MPPAPPHAWSARPERCWRSSRSARRPARWLDELTGLLWDDPPPSAVKTVRAHVSRLRAGLGRAGLDATIERDGRVGYRLAIDADQTDVGRVAALRARARALLADGRPDGAAILLAQARTLWRGDPELPDTTAAAALLEGWRREHRQLVTEHLECVTTGSDPGSGLGELAELTATDPLDESLWVNYVRALRRTGRQTEALRAVVTARGALAGVGLEPGAALRASEAEIFDGDPVPSSPGTRPTDGTRPTGGARPIDGPAVSVQYAEGQHGHTAFVKLSSGGPDLLVLNPAMITIDGLLDDPHPRSALTRLGEQRRVTCFDRRGIGLSDPLSAERAPLDDWVADVLLVLDAGGVSEADLFANFDTGLIALEFAARYPDRVRSLVLAQCFATYLRSDDYPFGLDPITADSLIRDATNPVTPAERLDTVVHAAPSAAHDAAFRQWWNRIGQRAAGPRTAATIRAIATRTDIRQRLPAVSAPTLVLHRRNCTNVDIGHSRYLADHLPDARLELVAGTDSLWFTDSDELLDRALTFLAGGG